MFEKVNIKYGIVIGLFLTIPTILLDLTQGLYYDSFFFEGLLFHLFFAVFWTGAGSLLISQLKDENYRIPTLKKIVYFLIAWSGILLCWTFLPPLYVGYLNIGMAVSGFLYLMYWIFK